jgi:serine/threonine protein kinase
MLDARSPRELAEGDTLGPFRLAELLGEGGMGLVFRALREPDGQVLALKILRRELSQDETYRRRFIHEARSAAEVRHPHLVPIIDAGELAGRQFLALEYVPGVTLQARLRAEGSLPLRDILGFVREVGAGLDALHERGIVHRDVKTSNIIFAADGSAMLMDFGLARGRAYTVLTRPGQVLGTLDYLAPELIRGEPATSATDLYALACVVYEAVAGKPPFSDRSLVQIGIAHLRDTPPDPGNQRADWSSALSTVLLQGLEKNPVRRPPTATDLARRLTVAAEGFA